MQLPEFDKYEYYSQSVQSPAEDMEFLENVYLELNGAQRAPKTMREDFCAAFLNCCEWVRRSEDKEAYGVDLDSEPLAYGTKNYLPRLTSSQKERVHILQQNVLNPDLPKVDVIAALNFSYFIFKERQELLQYYKNAYHTLDKNGVLIMDCFGGSNCWDDNEEETEFEDYDPPFSYYWDQDGVDPLTHHVQFKIHFKRKGEKKRLNVFTYDWRLWTVPEIKDLLLEAGFDDVKLYWEGSTEEGEGDGNFKVATQGEVCEGWVCYIAAHKKK